MLGTPMVSLRRYGQKVNRHTHTQGSKQGRGKLEGRDMGWQKREWAEEKGEKGGILS